jgi:hypothetical protein
MATITTPIKDETVKIDLAALAVADPAQAAQAALDNALNYCAEKMNLAGPQSALDQLRLGDDAAFGYFQYALAHTASAYLAGFDDEVKAVYMYDYEATPEDTTFGEIQPVSPLHLIVLVRRKTEALYSLVAALDRSLAGHYAVQAGLPKASHLLDAQVVDDAEVQRNSGYGAMLNSVYHRPVLVWER